MYVVIQQHYAVAIKSFYMTIYATVTPFSLLVSFKILCQVFGFKIMSLHIHCSVVI
jgi:hypothetical protein